MSQRPFCLSSWVLMAALSWKILSCIRLGHKPGVLVTGRCIAFRDLRSRRVPQIPSQPAHTRSELPSLLHCLRASFRSAWAAEGWDGQDDTQRVEIFMNELCWMNFAVCVQANKSVNEAENSCNWLMVSGVPGFYPIRQQLGDSCTINILSW